MLIPFSEYEDGVLVSQGTGEPDFYLLEFKEDGACIIYYNIDMTLPDVTTWTQSGVL